jgi:hypothetical protein
LNRNDSFLSLLIVGQPLKRMNSTFQFLLFTMVFAFFASAAPQFDDQDDNFQNGDLNDFDEPNNDDRQTADFDEDVGERATAPRPRCPGGGIPPCCVSSIGCLGK